MSDLDPILRSYLEEGKTARIKDGEKLDLVLEATRRNTNEIELLRQTMASDSRLVQHQIAGLGSRVNVLESDAEDTGVHNIAALNARLKDEKEAKSRMLGWIIAAIGSVSMLLLSGAGAVIWYLITRNHP